ncbi:MAG TPA: PilZ domain-containing protein [Kofleriaceae bacterium]|nr:PilZ domain-containing protein [Kofleriaceae bacterium]
MGDLAERRSALRVPVRGVAVFYGEDGATHGTIENLSSSGALVSVRGMLSDQDLDLELKLGDETGWVSARTVRIERTSPTRARIAVTFDRVEDHVRVAIENAIDHALRAAQRRPILVFDDQRSRRIELATRLAARGMTPLVPRTPLEAIDLLTRTQLHVNVAILATGSELATLLAESFPWVSTAPLSDDIDATVERAIDAWSGTDGARLATAIA